VLAAFWKPLASPDGRRGCTVVLKFRLLGAVTAESAGSPIDIGGLKPQLMLASLLWVDGEVVTLETLLERGWSEGETEKTSKPRALVHTCVNKLRGSLKKHEPEAARLIPRSGRGYQINVRSEQVDLFRFRRIARELAAEQDGEDRPAEISRLGQAALREWGPGQNEVAGESLVGLHGRWVRGVKTALRQEHHDVLISYMKAELRLDRLDRHIPALEYLFHTQPDESVADLLMRAYCRTGEWPKAVDTFSRFQRHLDEEYDDKPNAELWDLRRRVWERDPSLRRPIVDSPGAAMPPPEHDDLARHMVHALTPALPHLTGTAKASDRPPDGSLTKATHLWAALHRHGSIQRLPEAFTESPDSEKLRRQLEKTLADNASLAAEATRILDGNVAEGSKGQIAISGPYFHQGDNISGTSIKYYRG
jgi:DNA-binding SARP family transcriptional activator